MKFLSPCILCGALSRGGFCEKCRKRLETLYRPREEDILCSEGARSFYDYNEPEVRTLLFALKRSGLRLCVDFFCAALARGARELDREFVCVTYAPRRRAQVRKDGFDQARLLAKELARRLDLPFCSLISRRGRSAPQHGLSREKRRENVRGKFRAKEPLPRGEILLIDDVITTGATCEEACRTLLRAGAQSVFVLAAVKGGF